MIDFILDVLRVFFGFIGLCVISYTIPFCITRGINDAKKGR